MDQFLHHLGYANVSHSGIWHDRMAVLLIVPGHIMLGLPAALQLKYLPVSSEDSASWK